ncbi:MAG: hypothetical protein EP340_06710 [Alphaproteobacteria bacterium]|nr:MAG: hypothetical protein EP340_06710 [Alphaproteobacteria bacterium]
MTQNTMIYGIMETDAAEALMASAKREMGLDLRIEAKGEIAAVMGRPRLPSRLRRRKYRQAVQAAHYHRILERMMEEGAVLPAPMRHKDLTKRDLHGLLARHRTALRQLLAAVDDKVEMRISIKWDAGRFVHRALCAHEPENASAKTGLHPRTVAGLQDEILSESSRLKHALLEQLRPYIVDRLVEMQGALDDVLTARLLVKKSAEQFIYDILTHEDMGARGMHAQFQGPLPPLSFVDLKPLFEEASLLDAASPARQPQPRQPQPRQSKRRPVITPQPTLAA